MAKTFDGSTTFSRGSEPFFDLFCQPCSEEGKHLQAHGFCKDCKEYLCRDCYDNHTKPRPSRHHILLDANEMPKNAPSLKGRSAGGVCTLRCVKHPDEIVKYHCPKHDVVVCGVCVTVSHLTCGVDYIPDKASGIGESEEYKRLVQTIANMEKNVHAILQQSRQNLSNIQKSYDGALKAVQKVRAEINEIIDELEKRIQEEANKLKKEDDERMQTTIEKCNSIQYETKNLRKQITQEQESKQDCNLFVDIKRTREKLDALQNDLQTIEKNISVTYYEFERSEDIWDFINNTKAYGQLKRASQHIGKPVKLRVSHCLDTSLKTEGDKKDPTITGSVILPNGYIVVVDVFNRKVKQFNTGTFKPMLEISIPGEPWDITKTGRESVAIAVSELEEIICILVTENTLSVEQEIKASGHCVGIEFIRDKFYVSLLNPGRVEIVNWNGDVVMKILNRDDGENMFISPQYVASCGDLILVSDARGNKVTALDRSGIAKYEYKSDALTATQDIAVSKKGNVFVCDCESNNIHVISENGEFQQILLSEKDGLKGPQSISFCERTQRLFVTQEYDARLRVYSISNMK